MRKQTTSLQTSSPASWWMDSLLITLLLGVLFFTMIGSRPLFVPDEGRYAEIAREMAAGNDFITPYLNGIKYFEKPALFYWLGAAAIKAAGVNLWAVRSINAAIGLFGCLITYLITRQLFDRMTGLLSALILGSSTLYFVMSHMVSLDLPVTVFLAASLYSFLMAAMQTDSSRRWYCWCAAVAAALAVLTKGLIGVVFPLLIICVWLTLTKQWRQWRSYHLPTSIALFLIITVPWHVLVNLRNPEFFYFYFIEQHFLRYTNPDIGHYQPVWFFIPVMMAAFFPWIVFLPQSIYFALRNKSVDIREKHATLFLMLWALIIFTFFSFSKSKLIPYILPVLPPLAILTAHYLRQTMRWLSSAKGVKSGVVILSLLSATLIYSGLHFTKTAALPNAAAAQEWILAGTITLLIGSLTASFLAFKNQSKFFFLIFAATGLFLLSLIAAMPNIDSRTIRPLADIVKLHLEPDNEVITFNQYYQDLPFYLERRVTIVNWKNELTYGMQHQDTREWMIDTPAFWQKWNGPQRVFVIMSISEYQALLRQYPKKSFPLLGKTLTNVLLSNRAD